MHLWITRFFMLMTFGPLAVWAGCFLGMVILGGVYGCQINESGTYPCGFHGHDVGQTAAMMGILAAWGALIFGPFVAASCLAWGLYALIRRLRHGRK